MASAKVFLLTCLLGLFLREIHGYGMMLEPVSRSSAWRLGFELEPNYNDDQLYCGGCNIQYVQNGGRCGECGDDYALPRPRPNENGGTYGTGLIVKKYKAEEEIINVMVKLTANYEGSMSFDLCPLDGPYSLETEECFNRHPLKLADGRYVMQVPTSNQDFNIRVRLPANVKCDHCVLRWTYRARNNWGECNSNMLGLQTFRNCADISIV